MLATTILGLEIPESRPVFLTALAVHVTAGSVSIISGALTAFARKRPGHHPRAGKVYLIGLAGVFVTATVMSVMHWEHSWHLFLIASTTYGLGRFGVLARKRRWRRWRTWHGAAMGMSYVALYTGFYVDNGPQLPVWERLPPVMFWFLPSAVGIPLILFALKRNGALRVPRRRQLVREAA